MVGMVNVASEHDCRELYKISGWDGTLLSYFCDEERDDDPAVNLSEPAKVIGGVGYFDHQYPAYDAGYLLAKLPAHVLTVRGNGDWIANWTDYANDKHIVRDSRTKAENALCRLAIALFRSGILLKAK